MLEGQMVRVASVGPVKTAAQAEVAAEGDPDGEDVLSEGRFSRSLSLELSVLTFTKGSPGPPVLLAARVAPMARPVSGAPTGKLKQMGPRCGEQLLGSAVRPQSACASCAKQVMFPDATTASAQLGGGAQTSGPPQPGMVASPGLAAELSQVPPPPPLPPSPSPGVTTHLLTPTVAAETASLIPTRFRAGLCVGTCARRAPRLLSPLAVIKTGAAS
ncbi:hypothetical protein SKAU_G00382250 [Synaphobranchus kaupii]|uniref:Uncharacterized protein n=1 Tax=Synaphobranchus kaupii TaxID=118154 RepID=A0A9Q1IDY4_SYNKA|nr:hypothetical protein SKAU_G00382250 [Synaphobranchus kaupii]